MEEKIRNLVEKSGTFAQLTPKFSDKFYKEGVEVNCTIDKMTCGKLSVYATSAREPNGQHSLKNYENADDFFNDFKVK